MDSLFVDARIGSLAVEMLLGQIMDVLGGFVVWLGPRASEGLSVERLPELES